MAIAGQVASSTQAGPHSAPAGPHCTREFSIREARTIVADLFEPRPAVYWTDMLVSLTIGYACYREIRFMPLFSWQQMAFYVVAVLALYRASLFIHEIVHFRKGTFRNFRVAWNLLCGIPFLMPTFLYYTHVAHHARKHYATPGDGEYLPLATGSVWQILWYLSQCFVLPIIAILRFGLLAPLAWASPKLRRWVQQRASSMVIDPSYVRPLPSPTELYVWRMQEAACFLFVLGAAVLMIRGRVPVSLLAVAYSVAVGVLFLNAIRTLGAHRYRHDGHESLTFVDQLLDSVNYARWPLVAGLWAPVGLRFHALHHLFPSMPYHSLAAAHRRLMEQLPADNIYRQTESPGLLCTVRELWCEARKAKRKTPSQQLAA